jgi:hypothetical protein
MASDYNANPGRAARLRAARVLVKIAAEVAMKEYLRVARLYMIVLAIFTVGRLATGARGIPYERGHHIFSLVTMSLMASAFYGAFCRRWRGYGVAKAMGLGLTIGVIGQVVILLATVLSYAFHVNTYFVNPRALNTTESLSFGAALLSRIGGLVVNSVLNALAAAIGWVLGPTLPEPATRPV